MHPGALTFLFTDIEASTRRWDADAAAMSTALAGHDETVRAAITTAGGTVFKHTGDGMCAVFGSAAGALAGALAAQRRLAEGRLRVRMAIHSGDAEERDGDYFGPTLNRVARLMAAAAGGQTLVSAAAAELAADRIPPGSVLVDLGVHWLADLSRPEHVFQLTGEGLPARFPPLRGVSARRNNLPVALTPFVGREAELAEVTALLKTSRLVTMTGVGGAGKTRLATELALRSDADFTDGVFFAELAPVTDPANVSATVAAALNLILDEPQPLADQLATYLERRTALIILDNCEHVIDVASALTETILRRAPGIVMLATSREPLGVPGETVWRIPPLRASDGMELLRDRACRADPAFAPSETDISAMQRICTRLDGLPLALELAAARLHVLSPVEVAARLDDRFRLLTGGARTAVDRHRTLRAAVDWGYDLLDEASRGLLRRLSVFAGGFDLAAVEAVAGPDAIDCLSGLVDRSWVAIDPPSGGPTRYRLIETIRQYAAERLDQAGESAEAREAHCRHFRRLAERRRDIVGIELTWLDQARLEDDNLRSALEWATARSDRESSLELACALVSYLSFRGRGTEGRDWLTRALAIEPQDASRRTLVALWLLGAFSELEGDSEAGENALRQAAVLAERSGAASLAAHALTSLARQLSGRDPEGAAELLDPCPATMGGLLDAVWAALNHGSVRLAVSDPQAAKLWFGEALELAGANVVAWIHAAAALAPLAAADGETERASQLAHDAVKRAQAIDLPVVLVMALTRAAETAVLLGRPSEAARCVAESSRILRDIGTRAWVGDTLKITASVAAHRADHRAAARLLGAAHAVDATTGDAFRPQSPGADLAAERSRRGLGDQAFVAECAAGEALRMEDALTLALTTALTAPPVTSG